MTRKLCEQICGAKIDQTSDQNNSNIILVFWTIASSIQLYTAGKKKSIVYLEKAPKLSCRFPAGPPPVRSTKSLLSVTRRLVPGLKHKTQLYILLCF